MKITITQTRELLGGRIVRPGDELESPKDGTDEELAALVANQVASGDTPVTTTATIEENDNEH